MRAKMGNRVVERFQILPQAPELFDLMASCLSHPLHTHTHKYAHMCSLTHTHTHTHAPSTAALSSPEQL